MKYVLGIDKGTSMIKSVIFDEAGSTVAVARRRVDVLHPQAGWHEEDPKRTWALCIETTREALATARLIGSDIAAIGITGHMGGAILVDAANLPVRNAIGWPDERAQSHLLKLEAEGALDGLFQISGNGLMPGNTALLLGWLAVHDPDSTARAATFLCAKDYLRLRLTGVAAIDPSDVSFVPGDIDGRTFSAELMRACGAEAWLERLPAIVASEKIAGHLQPEAAELTGLMEGTPVITGLGDGAAAALGIGALASGSAFTVLGTSCLNSLVLDGPHRAPHGLGFLFAMPLDQYVRILPNTSGTMTMDWFLERFGGPQHADGSWDFNAMEMAAAAIPPGAGGVLLLPYINGAGVLAPFADPLARGAFFGMSVHTTRDHLLRAVYEALCYSTRDCFAAMPEAPTSLKLSGGGAQSPFWGQLFADVCGVPIEIPESAESGALGVALLAGVAVGMWPDLEAAVQRTSRVSARYEPDPVQTKIYDGWFGLYQALRSTYRNFSSQRAALMEQA
ncbi:FGGY-family carbohydrate kinase [Variovorax sp. LG9.2]|jgi:sugar (pentulose or hexulose) kinase|uniref:FGGY-family carbohydrate kinase n=1 Tax=Variovorax sp. LG9.2 TaxID=3048626 RepID=UPI002B23E78B|nr:FGGY-family carbohydrate kinase [Variovorax sp. LG9.2]MEB0055714.1 FGGY-family carbohydrate kinase [Variovorax sp. LG9.2]